MSEFLRSFLSRQKNAARRFYSVKRSRGSPAALDIKKCIRTADLYAGSNLITLLKQSGGLNLRIKILYAEKAVAALSLKINTKLSFVDLCGDSQKNQPEIVTMKPLRSRKGLFYAVELIWQQ